MIQKTKKRLITFLLVAIWLVSCYFIGQITHPQVAEDAGFKPGSESSIVDIESTPIVSFMNAIETNKEEIPWGFNAGVIELENGTEAWLLTPGTGLQLELTANVIIHYTIHPWMKDTSDGALIQIVNGEKNDSLMVDHEWKDYLIVPENNSVKIEALTTENNDGDWIIIQSQREGNT